MKTVFSIFLSATLCCCFSIKAFTQTINLNELVDPATESGLLRGVLNDIYYTYYSPLYMANRTPVFTVLKVDLNQQGKIEDMTFSDNTTAGFANAYLNNKDIDIFKQRIEKYAQKTSLAATSILIPISYQPNAPNKERIFTYQDIQSATKFRGDNLNRAAIALPPVHIIVLSKNNM